MNFSHARSGFTEAKVAALPGSPFGAGGYFRFSYATSGKNITGGMHRIEEFAKKVK